MSLSVPIDTTDLAVTPLFKYITRENVNESERQGHAVMETFVGVELSACCDGAEQRNDVNTCAI